MASSMLYVFTTIKKIVVKNGDFGRGMIHDVKCLRAFQKWSEDIRGSQLPNSDDAALMRAHIPCTSPRARRCANGFISMRCYYYPHFQVSKWRLREGRKLAHSHTVSGGAECLCYWPPRYIPSSVQRTRL